MLWFIIALQLNLTNFVLITIQDQRFWDTTLVLLHADEFKLRLNGVASFIVGHSSSWETTEGIGRKV